MTTMRTAGVLVAGLVLGVAGTLAAQNAAGTSRREPQFENATAKAWKSIIMPKQPLSFHRHDHSRAIIALTDATLDLVQPSGAKTQNVWQAGKAYWYGPDAAGTTHADVNNTDKPIEVIVVELQQP